MSATAEEGFVVTPRGPGSPLRSLWRARGLLAAFAGREVAIRYRQAALGILWALAQPLALAAAATLAFHGVLGAPSDGAPYAAFVLAGLVPWSFFQGSVAAATPSLVQNANLVRKTWFPRESIPLSIVLAALLDLSLGLAAVVVTATLLGHPPGTASLTGLLVLPGLVAFAAAGALLGASLDVRWRDAKHAAPLVLQALFFATPVVYPLSAAPESWRFALSLNPMVGVVEGLRSALLFDRSPDAGLTLLSASVAAGFLVLAYLGFKAADRRFADFV